MNRRERRAAAAIEGLPKTDAELRQCQRLMDRVVAALAGGLDLSEKLKQSKWWLMVTESEGGSVTIEAGDEESVFAEIGQIESTGNGVATLQRCAATLTPDERGVVLVLPDGGMHFRRVIVSNVPFRNTGTEMGKA